MYALDLFTRKVKGGEMSLQAKLTSSHVIMTSAYQVTYQSPTFTFIVNTTVNDAHFQMHHVTPKSLLLLILTLHHLTQRPFLHHQGHDFVQRIRRRHRRQLSVGVVRRCNLDNVRRY